MMPLAAYENMTRVGSIDAPHMPSRVVIGRLRRGSDRLGAIQVQHQVDLGEKTSKKIGELQKSVSTLRTGVIVVGVAGAIAMTALRLYLATRPRSGRR